MGHSQGALVRTWARVILCTAGFPMTPFAEVVPAAVPGGHRAAAVALENGKFETVNHAAVVGFARQPGPHTGLTPHVCWILIHLFCTRNTTPTKHISAVHTFINRHRRQRHLLPLLRGVVFLEFVFLDHFLQQHSTLLVELG